MDSEVAAELCGITVKFLAQERGKEISSGIEQEDERGHKIQSLILNELQQRYASEYGVELK